MNDAQSFQNRSGFLNAELARNEVIGPQWSAELCGNCHFFRGLMRRAFGLFRRHSFKLHNFHSRTFDRFVQYDKAAVVNEP